ncbi:MAG: endo-1,4-beta-xylanase [Treponemataceae bacterium]|nr:endo-1,4-beta-xylanase [Treponemataceae bacterium]
MRKFLLMFTAVCAFFFIACKSTSDSDVVEPAVEAVAPVQENVLNVVYYNSFDGSLDDWTPRGGNEVFQYVDGALFISGRTATWNGAIRSFGDIFVPGIEYNISVTVKYTDGKDGQSVVMSSQQGQADGSDTYANLKTINLVKGEWTTAEFTYTVPSNADEFPVLLYFESPYKSDSAATPDDFFDFYIDEIKITSDSIAAASAPTDLPPLYEKFSFPLGVAVRPEQFKEASIYNPILDHFNAYVCENVMKQDAIQPSKGVFKFGPAETVVNAAAEEGKLMRGHTLVWHSQVPAWFFQGTGAGGVATKAELYDNMKTHIETTMGKFKGKVDSWDVVNECIEENGSLRNSKYLEIAGSDEYIANAFRWAREADPSAKLFINDYNIEYSGAKQNGMYNLVKKLLAEGVPIDGVGLQCHIGMTYPALSEIQKAIQRFASLGVKVQVTELDMSVYSNDNEKEKSPDDEVLIEQAYRYKQLFEIFEEEYKAGRLDMVMIWGAADKDTWLNNFPVSGRDNYPLFFDHKLNAKPCYWIFIDESKVPPLAPKAAVDMSKFPRISVKKGSPVLGKNDAAWKNAASFPIELESMGAALKGSTFKALWDEKNIYVRVEVKDKLLNCDSANEYEQDSVEVFIDQNNAKTSFYEDDDGQYRVNFNNLASFNGGNESLFKSYAETVSGGYIVEMACPLDKISPAKGTMIGFDVQINEADASGARTGVRNWSNSTNEGYRDTSSFGIAVFE